MKRLFGPSWARLSIKWAALGSGVAVCLLGAPSSASAEPFGPGLGGDGDQQNVSGGASLKLPSLGDTLDTSDARSAIPEQSGVPVNERRHPDYDAAGLRLGAFRLAPEIQNGLAFDSNVFSRANGASDLYGQIRGKAVLDSIWVRHALKISGIITQREYSKYSSEDALTYEAQASGRYDLGRADHVSFEAQRSRDIVERGQVGEILGTRRPVRYNLTSGSVGGQLQVGRLGFEASGLVGHYDYEDALSPSGNRIDEQFRDFNLYEARLRLGYALASGANLYISVTGDSRRYRIRSRINRDEDGYELLIGIRSEITPLIRGRLGVGYVHADFKDPTVKGRGIFTFDVNLNYLVTKLTTINLTGRRYFQNVGLVSAPALLTTEVRLGVDHELLRNVIISSSVGYSRSNYVASPASARRLDGAVSIQWLMSRRLRSSFTASYRQRDGQGRPIDRDFKRATALVSLSYRL